MKWGGGGGGGGLGSKTAPYMRAWSGKARKSVCVRPATMPYGTRACDQATDDAVPTLDANRTAQSTRNADKSKTRKTPPHRRVSGNDHQPRAAALGRGGAYRCHDWLVVDEHLEARVKKEMPLACMQHARRCGDANRDGRLGPGVKPDAELVAAGERRA
jgi:hypothetical protein